MGRVFGRAPRFYSLKGLLYGQRFVVYNDHLPLRSIFNKPLAKSPARIQRFLLRLQRYDFTVEYIPGRQMLVADALSRAPLPENTPEIPDAEVNTYIHSVILNLPISDNRLQQFQSETAKGEALTILRDQIQSGWPANRRDAHPSVRMYFDYQTELSINHKLILKGDRIVVPTTL